MECIPDKRARMLSLFFVLFLLVSCIPATTERSHLPLPDPPPTWQPASPTSTLTGPVPLSTLTPTASATDPQTAEFTPSMTPTATRCPRATQELLSVDPVTSPTDQFSQTITVHMGNMEWVKIVTESGTFTATGTGSVEISLLPDTVHHLEVMAKVRKVVGWQGCAYGNYVMTTTRDRQGAPLTIVQGEPIPRQANEILTAENPVIRLWNVQGERANNWVAI